MTSALLGRRTRLAEQVSSAAYGTVLVLVSLVLVDAEDVASGAGWELTTAVGVATWIAHLYAEVVGDCIRNDVPLDQHEIRRAMIDGAPILAAPVAPALVLLAARLGIVESATAQWVAVGVATMQLVALGAFVGTRAPKAGKAWSYGAATGLAGVVVVTLKIAVGH